MKLLTRDYKKGFVKLEIQNPDDLWYLSTVIDQGDRVSALTERKIKLGGEDQRSTKVIRKKVWLSINAEKIQFSKTSHDLRITGTIAEGKEDIAAGDYHTLTLAPGEKLSIDKGKKGFLKFQIDKLEDASRNTSTQILVCAIDRGEATLAHLKTYGYDLISTIKGEVQKKDFKEKIRKDFFKEAVDAILQTAELLSVQTIIIGTVAFWKDNIKKEIDAKKPSAKVLYTSCSSSGENGINEIIAQEEVKLALQDERFAVESALVNEVLSRIAKQEAVAYGFKETESAANLGAVAHLLVSDETIRTMREAETYDKLDAMMRVVDKSNGEITIVSSDHEGGEQLNGLGGVAALLRFRIEN
ncbi:MAG: mRNA surveillance protein pelota [Nanoarchaeota archaeon]